MKKMCYRCMTLSMQGGQCKNCKAHEVVRSGQSDVLPLGTLLEDGNIVVGDILGKGGFGITYIARDNAKDCVIALKEFFPNHLATRKGLEVVTKNDQQEVYDRCMRDFQREARLISTLHTHPNIVDVYFTLEENNTCYYGMQLLHGKSLRKYLSEKGPTDLNAFQAIFSPVIDAIAYMHQQGMLHRDISPDNIFLRDSSEHHADFWPCLIDFGAAYSARSDFTQTLPRVKNPYFSPLEQNSGLTEKNATMDVYALCATMYYALTGEPPTPATDRACGFDLAPITKFNKHLPEALWDVINDGMALDPKSRIQTVKELSARLNTVIESSPKEQHKHEKARSEHEPLKQKEEQRIIPFQEQDDAHQGARHMSLLSCILEWLLFYFPFLLFVPDEKGLAMGLGFALNLIVNIIFSQIPPRTAMGQKLLGLSWPERIESAAPLGHALYAICRAIIPFTLVDELLTLCNVYSEQVAYRLFANKPTNESDEMVTMECLVRLDTDMQPIGEPLFLGTSIELGRDHPWIPVEAKKVSRNHCGIFRTENGYVLQDHGSTNGTSVNGECIPDSQPILLHENDLISLAEGQVQLQFVHKSIPLAQSQLYT